MTLSNHDKILIRDLAKRLKEIANAPKSVELRRLWTRLHDLRPERPMILLETDDIFAPLQDEMTSCEDPFLRSVEFILRRNILHATEVGDDYAPEAVFDLDYEIAVSDYGVELKIINNDPVTRRFQFNTPIKTVQDMDKLKPRTFSVDREKSEFKKAFLQDIFGDTLEIRQGYGTYYTAAGLTSPLFSLIGMENMLYWLYDEPQAFHRIMEYLCNDRISMYKWLESENLLALNNNQRNAGSGSIGFTSSLPSEGYDGRVRLKDMWCFNESQETLNVSPDMFAEFVLPYLKRVSDLFGLTYYGCCEPLHDRWHLVRDAIPNIRSVAVSPWCNKEYMSEACGKNFVCTFKPSPAHLTGRNPNWDNVKKDLKDIARVCGNNNTEIIMRDLLDIGKRNENMRRWSEFARSALGI